MAFITLVICLLLSSCVLGASQEVACYNDLACASGQSTMSTINDCCDHRFDPPGLGYRVQGASNCTACPNEFGFFNTTFTGIERGEPYAVEVGTISGSRSNFVIVTISLQRITAGVGDMELLTTDLALFEGRNPLPVSFIFKDDSIAEESEETFNLTIATTSSLAGYTTRLVLMGTILDDDIAITIGMNVRRVTVDEDIGMTELCASVVGEFDREIVVSVVYQDRGAIGGSDFEVNVVMLTFAPGMLQDCFNVTIIDDDLYENPEEFFANITTLDTQVTISPMTTVITIIDNDVVVIGWEMTIYTQSESEEQIELCAVIQSGILAVTIPAINIRLVDGTAVAGDDYDAQPSRSFFAFSSTTDVRMCATVTIIDDDSFENDVENFFANLKLASNAPRLWINTSQAEIQINDEDTITIGLNVSRVTVDEDIGMTELCASIVGEFDREVVVFVVYQDRGAIGGSDFEVNVVMLTFAPGMLQDCFNVTIIDDDLYENPEEFFANITTIDTQVNISPMTTVITIIDNDEVVIGWEMTIYTQSESEEQIELCAVIQSGILAVVVPAINIRLVDGTAVAGDDYDAQPSRSFFAFSSTTDVRMCAMVTIIDDDSFENDVENFFANLELASNAPRLWINTSQAEIQINDEDTITIGLNVSRVTVDEDVGMTELCASVVGDFSRDVQVSVVYQDNGAIGGSDFNGNIVMLTFVPGMLQDCFNVTIIEDGLFENPEEFFANITTIDTQVTISPMTTVITIIDNDEVVIGWEMTVYTQSESEEQVELCAVIQSGMLDIMSLAINIRLVDGTAVAGDDYDAQPSRSFFAFSSPTVVRMCATVTIIDDDSFENDVENFFAYLALASNASRVMIDPSQAEIQINDEDTVTIGLDVNRVTVVEDVGITELCASTNDELEREVVVSVVYQDRGAIGGGDFEGNIVKLTFAPGMLQDCFNVTIIDDDLYENPEEFFANITTIDTRVTISPMTTVITIIDNDEFIIGWEMILYTQSESGVQVEICAVVQSGMLAVTIPAINIRLVDGSAVAGDDYDAQPSRSFFVFSSTTDVRMCATVTIIDDDSFENDVENFFAHLALASNGPRVMIKPSQAEIHINDEDTVLIGFDPASYTVGEGDGSVSVVVGIISGSLSIDVLVTLDFSDEQAVANPDQDFNSSLTTLTFSSTVSSQSVNIAIIDDEINEGDESFRGLFLFSTDPRVLLDSTSADILIQDNDAILVRFDQPSYTFNEGDGTVSITVVKEGNSDEPFTIRVTGGPSMQTNVTNSAPAINETIIFGIGDVPPDSFRISLTLTDDQVAFEVVEMYTASLEIISGTNIVMLGTPEETVINIIGDELVIGFDQLTYAVREDERYVNITIVLTGRASRDFLFTLSTRDGSAVSIGMEADFLSATKVLTFSPSSLAIQTTVIQIAIINDNLVESTENLDGVLTLNTIDEAINLQPSEAFISIIDDDAVVIGFDQTLYSINVSVNVVDVVVRVLSGDLRISVKVNFTTAGNTALDGSDYLAVSQSLTFDDDTTSNTISVPIIVNDFLEDEEFFGQLTTSEDSNVVMLDPALTTIEILNVVTIGFSPVNYSVNEVDGSVTLSTMLLSGTLEREVCVQFSTIDASATETDYEARTFDLTFSSTISQVNISIPIINDTSVEDFEHFLGTLHAQGTSLTIIASPDTATVVIREDPTDTITIGLDFDRVTVYEDVGMTELCASTNDELEREVVVSVVYQDRGAFGGSDFEVNIVMLTFVPGMLQDCFNVVIIDDDLYENPEEFFANITTIDPQVTISPMTTVITIIDKDEVLIGWEMTIYTQSETEKQVELCTVIQSGMLAVTIPAINIRLVDGTAVAGDDYDAQPSRSFFAFSSTTNGRMCSTVTIIDDDSFENDVENFFAHLALASNAPRVMINPSQAEIQINDEDNVVIGFDPASYTVGEGDGSVSVVVEIISGSLSIDVLVTLDFSDEQAVANPDQDFNTSLTTLIFSSTVSSQSINIAIIDDEIDEGDELFSGFFIFSTNPRVLLDSSSADILIQDNDELVIGFDQPTYAVVEDEHYVNITIMLTGRASREVLITLSTRDGSAVSIGMEADFVSTTQVLTFSPSSLAVQTTVIQIAIIDDSLVESTENLDGVLTLNTTDEAINLLPSDLSISIIDNDAVVIGFDQTLYSFNENVNAIDVIVRVLSGNLRIPVEVNFTTADNTAIDGSHYLGVRQSLTFDDGTTSISISISIIGNDIHEDGDEFFSQLTTSVDSNVVMLDPALTTIAILDVIVGPKTVVSCFEDLHCVEGSAQMSSSYDCCDHRYDPPGLGYTIPGLTRCIACPREFGFFNTTFTGIERGEPYAVDVGTISGSRSNFVIVTISLKRITAGVGDVELLTTDLALFEGRNPLPVSFIFKNDSVAEESKETFNLTIATTSSLTGYTTRLVLMGTILDDDNITIRFEHPSYTLSEGVGSAEVCLIKDLMTSRNITISDIFTSDITTSVGSDYIGGPYSVTFGLGANDRQCISITFITDSEHESPESFSVTLNLSLAGNDLMQPGSPSTISVTIEDIFFQVLVNDTVIGKPLYTVPILASEVQLQNLQVDKLSLCYEVHGESGEWFNLVTDECVSVNTHYVALSERLNIMNSIGVRAVDNDNQCVYIGVDVNECAATVNGASLNSMGRYSAAGVNVKRFSNRVRISVPNCAELTLVMWVICERRTLDDPGQPGMDITADIIKFVVMRGLNFGHRKAHGLLGQFWNIPVNVSPYTGQLNNGNGVLDPYVVNITIGDTMRSYVGILYQSTWDKTEEPCLYVGSRQSGPIGGVIAPNDPVIASMYTDYKVSAAYSEEEYEFGLFNEKRCRNRTMN